MKKILVSLMVIGLVSGGIGGVYTAFSNPAAAINNILTAGTLDLKTNDADGIDVTINFVLNR